MPSVPLEPVEDAGPAFPNGPRDHDGVVLPPGRKKNCSHAQRRIEPSLDFLPDNLRQGLELRGTWRNHLSLEESGQCPHPRLSRECFVGLTVTLASGL